MDHLRDLSPAWQHWRATIDLDQYDQRFADMDRRGEPVHGEADAVQQLLETQAKTHRQGPSVIVDGGTGTGRIGLELAARGHQVIGIDNDPDMLARARAKSDTVTWVLGDLATAEIEETVDLVLLAGNLLVFVNPGTQGAVIANMAAMLAPGGLLVAGFGTAMATSPAVHDVRRWCSEAGLEPVAEWATWDGEPYTGGDYLVSVNQRPGR